MWIFGCLADLSVIIIAGNKPFYRVKHLKSEENSINVRELQNTNHVEVSDITPPLCHVCVVHVPGVDKIIFRGITQHAGQLGFLYRKEISHIGRSLANQVE